MIPTVDKVVDAVRRLAAVLNAEPSRTVRTVRSTRKGSAP